MRPPGQRQPAPRRAGGQVEELGPLHPAHRQRSPSKTSARLSSSVPEPFLVGNQLRSTGLSGLPRAADLIRVVVGVGRVDLDPRLHAVGAALGVRPTPRPMLLVEPVEDLGRRLPRRGDSLDRCLDRALGMERCPSSGRAPRDAGAAVRITSAVERVESLRLSRRAERSRDRLTCEPTAGIVPEADTVAPAGVDESGASVPSYPLMR
jgi:hypothetical protein